MNNTLFVVNNLCLVLALALYLYFRRCDCDGAFLSGFIAILCAFTNIALFYSRNLSWW